LALSSDLSLEVGAQRGDVKQQALVFLRAKLQLKSVMDTVKQKRTFQGIVVSDRMDKTRVVRVDRMKVHPKYHKHYKVSKRFKVHDEKNEYHTGDTVIFEECRPLSRDKRWRIIGKKI